MELCLELDIPKLIRLMLRLKIKVGFIQYIPTLK